MSTPALATAAEGATRIILVHGTGHGGWCWYRVATLLRAAGHRVDAPDLAASCPRRYMRPLLDALRALLPGRTSRWATASAA
ncbi:probable esterase PIR7A [Sorghum bicolor]|uniref:probable esterase PIR7A n=1 Tax=Sorghum bicolor TaxID=4558 RepID=UPI000B425E2E|nr:probable esterase PIR7A [Sorghum bicolor]|eukprot:XP_021311219.1 probable esterase PIR7A [Sorghum bicolor]